MEDAIGRTLCFGSFLMNRPVRSKDAERIAANEKEKESENGKQHRVYQRGGGLSKSCQEGERLSPASPTQVQLNRQECEQCEIKHQCLENYLKGEVICG